MFLGRVDLVCTEYVQKLWLICWWFNLLLHDITHSQSTGILRYGFHPCRNDFLKKSVFQFPSLMFSATAQLLCCLRHTETLMTSVSVLVLITSAAAQGCTLSVWALRNNVGSTIFHMSRFMPRQCLATLTPLHIATCITLHNSTTQQRTSFTISNSYLGTKLNNHLRPKLVHFGMWQQSCKNNVILYSSFVNHY